LYDLKSKVAIVTGVGGEHGIGRAIALRLAKEGADVVVSDLTANPKSSTWAGLPSVVEEIECLGRKAIAIEADISNSAHVDRLVQGTIQQFGYIDILSTTQVLLQVLIVFQLLNWRRRYGTKFNAST
jgi:NAD(P)-dependent dehydrogenase (short-subunit alcohol dehydrogenase family)